MVRKVLEMTFFCLSSVWYCPSESRTVSVTLLARQQQTSGRKLIRMRKTVILTLRRFENVLKFLIHPLKQQGMIMLLVSPGGVM